MKEKSSYTKLPNELLDKYMTELKGSELKVLLSICRKTIGWHKDTDKISTSQLMKMTGLSNKPVINASKSLGKMGLITSKRANGKPTTYKLTYGESTQVEGEPMEKVHSSYGESTQVTYGESTHTKETLKETRQKKHIPTLQQVKEYFKKNGYSEDAAEKAFNYYNTSLEDHPKRKYWRDSKDNKIKNWKMKMQSVWFKPENEENNKSQFRPDSIHVN